MTIVTLTTDFGTKDHYVSVLKGSILSAIPEAKIIDISHDVKIYNINHGALILSSSYSSFPKDTIHVVSIDGADYSSTDYMFFYHDGHYFVGPNNGIFSIAFPILPGSIYQSVTRGQDLYKAIAEIVAALSRKADLIEVGKLLTPDKIVERLRLQPVLSQTQIRATIIHADHFGNLFINLKKEVFDEIRNKRDFRLYYKSTDPITAIHENYQDVPVGAVLCRFNASEYLELSVHLGNAEEELGLTLDETIQIEFV